MNVTTHAEFFARLKEHAAFRTRRIGRSACVSFGSNPRTEIVGRIYVINLDRKPDRWDKLTREVRRMRDKEGRALATMTRRFSAIDARYLDRSQIAGVIDAEYSLGEQFFVQPVPVLGNSAEVCNRAVSMTPQEIAVALSHIDVWRRIAAGDSHYTLVLEDDTYFTRTFVPVFDKAWAELMVRRDQGLDFDLLYLSYREAGGRAEKNPVSDSLFEPVSGLWQLSGYVLSRPGAERLVNLLPVRGPVDLWINHQFEHLDVVAIRRSIIEQSPGAPSTNAYSVLPVLSEIGVLSREKPLLAKSARLPGPVFAYGSDGSGLTALATALSMLGYRCCSDVTDLPPPEHDRIFSGKRDTVFNAYVNVGSLAPNTWIDLAKRYRNARFVLTTGRQRSTDAVHDASLTTVGCVANVGGKGASKPAAAQVAGESRGAQLVLPVGHRDKWQLLSEFLGCEYPAHAYPVCADQPQRPLCGARSRRTDEPTPRQRPMKGDRSPWIAPRHSWEGVALQPPPAGSRAVDDVVNFEVTSGQVDDAAWCLRDDTFPGNLSVFRPRNVALRGDGVAELIFREEKSPVRDYTSGSIASRRPFTYGRFVADIRPAGVRGLITGMFLHRNSPRQEIDIEFLGKDPTKMLVNVYYNPGQEGTKLEYGYRGTPALIDLGFDSAADFHRYEIEWRLDGIRWRVDGQLVHERFNWNPTPVPHLPMQFNVNLWYSRSRELGGSLGREGLPARALVRGIRIET